MTPRVIGHSLSDVDYPYFKEIIKYNRDSTEMKWCISWHSVDDLRRITRFVSVMDISNSNVELFRTFGELQGRLKYEDENYFKTNWKIMLDVDIFLLYNYATR
ncbi:MAG: hypothetical protein PHU69_10825 [Fermentimonas sp.]|nr:hypothetical protein [Fermentimonas sp.]